MASYRGTDGVGFVSHGEWSDPEIVYGDYVFNYWDIEDALWSEFCEIVESDTGLNIYQIEAQMDKYEPMFDEFVQENCIPYLEDCIAGGYFD